MSAIPKLRFKEFKEKWENKNIGSLLTIGSGRDYKHLGNGNIPVYGTGGLMTTVDQFLYDGETVCIGRKGTIDKPVFHNGKIWTVDTLFYTHSFVNATPKFVYNLFQKIKWKEYNEASGVPSLSKTTIEKIHISIPSLPEQQKIASFLSSVDEKIQHLTRKKELLEQYKKGVMQQLFSDKLRFKDENGKAYPKWEEKRLGDVGKIRMCKRIFSNQTSEIGDIPFYKIGTFGKEADAYIPMSLFLEFKEKYPYPKVGEILMSASGTLGRTVIYDGSDAYFQDSNIVWIENNEELVTNAFLFYVYQVVRYKSEGGTIQRLYNDIINRALFLRPSLPEQQKVTNFLSALDSKIEHITSQITQVQIFKKGLLQQMFV